MKIVVTGATGFIGRHVAQRMVQVGHDVYCIVRPTSNCGVLPKRAKVVMPHDNGELYDLMQRIRPDVVVHIAGMFLGEHTEQTIQQMLHSNIDFPVILLDAAVSAGCKRVVNTGSYWQYFESDVYCPVNLYAATKQAFEDVLAYYVETKGVSVVDLMLFDVYGYGDTRRKVLNLVADLKDGESMAMSPGNQELFFCYVEDVVDAYMCAMEMVHSFGDGECVKYAVRDREPIRLRDFIEMYLDIVGKNVVLRWGDLSYRKREIMNPRNIGEILPGWRPKYSLKEGLLKYAEGGTINGDNTGW